MEENKEKKTEGQENNTHQKAGWMIGFALIIFLVLVLGSIIGLKMVRDKANEVAHGSGGALSSIIGGNGMNYTVWEDGTKENTNKGVTDAEIFVENISFSNFRIIEYHYTAEESDVLQQTEISMTVENKGEDATTGSKDFTIQLLDDDGKVLGEYRMQLGELPAHEAIPIKHYLSNNDSVNASSVVVKEWKNN